MSSILRPWHLVLITLAGLMNRQQQQKIEYLITKNQVLKEKLGKKDMSHWMQQFTHMILDSVEAHQ